VKVLPVGQNKTEYVLEFEEDFNQTIAEEQGNYNEETEEQKNCNEASCNTTIKSELISHSLRIKASYHNGERLAV